jgi:hypothetical protein
MRLGRILLLASLAQLLGLSALAAALAEHPAFTQHSSEEPVWKSFLQPVGVDAHSVISSHDRSSLQAVLALTALSETPLKHSLWLVAPAVRTVAVPRPRHYALLRC